MAVGSGVWGGVGNVRRSWVGALADVFEGAFGSVEATEQRSDRSMPGDMVFTVRDVNGGVVSMVEYAIRRPSGPARLLVFAAEDLPYGDTIEALGDLLGHVPERERHGTWSRETAQALVSRKCCDLWHPAFSFGRLAAASVEAVSDQLAYARRYATRAHLPDFPLGSQLPAREYDARCSDVLRAARCQGAVLVGFRGRIEVDGARSAEDWG